MRELILGYAGGFNRTERRKYRIVCFPRPCHRSLRTDPQWPLYGPVGKSLLKIKHELNLNKHHSQPSVSMYATYGIVKRRSLQSSRSLTLPWAPPRSEGNCATTLMVWAICVFPVRNSPYTLMRGLVSRSGITRIDSTFGNGLRHNATFLGLQLGVYE